METKSIKESQSFCSFCRISLNTKQERLKGYHEACFSEVNEFKDEMGVWYYLQMVNATDSDYETDSNGNIISLDLSNRHLFDIPELPFKELRQLDVSYNRLSVIPQWIFDLPHLELMSFPGNGFSQSLVYDMLRLNEKGVLVHSTGLKFEQNRLKTINFTYVSPYRGQQALDFPEEIVKYFGSVDTVNISHNGLIKLPNWLFRIKHLENLLIAGNHFSASDLAKLKSFKDLESIKMTTSNLSRDQEHVLEELEAKGVVISNYESRYYWWSADDNF